MQQQNLFEEQPRTKVVHFKKKPFDIYIGRPSKWGNPYSHKEDTIAEFRVSSKKQAIEKYREYLLNNKELLESLPEVKGKTLGCWCGTKSCHGWIIAELADKL